MPTYKIGELAARHGLTLRALRFYEARYGLLKPTRDGRRRIYSENDALRVAEIVRGIRLGFTLDEIKAMLENGPTGPWLAVTKDAAIAQREVMQKQCADAAAAVTELDKIVRRLVAGL